MSSAEWKDFARPDEVRTFPHGRIELLHIGGGTVGRMTLEPGWRWSTYVKPIAGTEADLGAGTVHHLQSGHDAWVVGNEPVVAVDWFGATNYAKKT